MDFRPGRLVDCKKEEIFIITYCATGRRSLGRHTDGDGKRTLLITLDASRDYAGGGTRFLLTHGDADEVVLPECGAAAARLLRDAGLPHKLVSIPGAGHSSDPCMVAALVSFLREVLPDLR